LIFAIDIKHAENIKRVLNELGVLTDTVHSKMKTDRSKVIRGFEKGLFQCLVSVSALTTGFDVPAVDLIAILRPTLSPVLHVQMPGRGFRVCPEEKEDCLILDYAGNFISNGPIDNPVLRISGQGNGTGEAIMKECPGCSLIVPAATRRCTRCNHKFEFKHKLKEKPTGGDVLSKQKLYKVTDVNYYKHKAKSGENTMRVVYSCGLQSFNEYICLEHFGYGRMFAETWWRKRSKTGPPDTVQQAIEQSNKLRKPTKILVSNEGKYTEIIKFFFKVKVDKK
jgi:DNA repair protein RadD